MARNLSCHPSLFRVNEKPMSPTGIFVSLSQTELDALRVDALAQIQSGRRTSLSGGGKSGSKEWSMSAQDILREVVYAEQQNGTRAPRAQKVVNVLNNQYTPVQTDSTY